MNAIKRGMVFADGSGLPYGLDHLEQVLPKGTAVFLEIPIPDLLKVGALDVFPPSRTREIGGSDSDEQRLVCLDRLFIVAE